MTDTVTCEAILVARTVPEQTKDGDTGICSVWFQPNLGGLIRVYPLELRWKLHVWGRYRLTLEKSSKDSRWRSYRVTTEPELIAQTKRHDLRDELVRRSKGVTVRRLDEQRDSLGIIHPVIVAGALERDTPETSKRFGRKTYPVRPRLIFRDDDGEHALALNDWGCFEWIRKGNDPARLWDNLKLGYPDREQLLLVGNQRDHRNAWLVIAVIGYGTDPALFGTIPGELRQHIFERDHHRCRRCGGRHSLSIDHIIPKSRGGGNDEDNLRVLCLWCSSFKGDRLDFEVWPSEQAEGQRPYWGSDLMRP